jgi:large repetitive protein
MEHVNRRGRNRGMARRRRHAVALFVVCGAGPLLVTSLMVAVPGVASAAGDVTITTTSLPGAGIGSPYSGQLSATGGNAPYTWKLVAGTGKLPTGLTLNKKTGRVSGSPRKSSVTSSFTVEVLDTKTSTKPHTQNEATASFTITIDPVLRNTSVTGPGVAVGDVLTQNVSFDDSNGLDEGSCSGTAQETVATDPTAPSDAVLNLTSVDFTNCAGAFVGASLTSPSTMTIDDATGLPVSTGALSFAVEVSIPGYILNETATTGGFLGSWSNADSSSVFDGQSVDFSGSTDTVDVTFGPFHDTSVSGSPLVFVS